MPLLYSDPQSIINQKQRQIEVYGLVNHSTAQMTKLMIDTTFHTLNVDTCQSFSVTLRTVIVLSCDIDGEMSCLTSEQKQPAALESNHQHYGHCG